MTTSTLQIRVDNTLRSQAEDFFNGAGLDMSSAVRLFLKQVVIRRRIPFDVIAEDPFWPDANQRVLAESIRSIEEGKGERHNSP